jgi:predicted glutamine amidotransferase
MCRWMGWFGQPMILEELLFQPKNSLVVQSLHAQMGVETTNGDGFGLGWYGAGEGAGIYRSVSPAWNDANLRGMARHIASPLFLAHVRASTGTPVQETNCHPFGHGRWIMVHNGSINDWPQLRRDLTLAVDPRFFHEIQGTTDSEVLFFLALTLGLGRDPLGALERAVGLVEAASARRGREPAVQASIGLSDGEHLWAVRYSTQGLPRSLFVSGDVDTVKRLNPDNPRLQRLRLGDRIVVSEPLSDLPGAWHEVPPSTALVIGPDGALEHRPFRPTHDPGQVAAESPGGTGVVPA